MQSQPSPRKKDDGLEQTPPIVRELREKQQHRILRQRRERMQAEQQNQQIQQQHQLGSEINQRQLEAQLRQQRMTQSFITPPSRQTRAPQQARAAPTPPTREKPEWIRKKYTGKSLVHIPSTEEANMERERQLNRKSPPQWIQETRKMASKAQTTISG
jgi:hypothetical protein